MTAETLLEHAGFVRHVARALLDDDHLVEDVVQDTWVAALTQRPGTVRNLRAWLGRVARNFALRRRLREHQRPVRERATAQPGRPPAPSAVVEQLDLVRQVADHVLHLDETDRELIVLRYYREQPPSRIARELDLPLATVKTRLRRALQRLRARLDRETPGGRRAWSLAVGALLHPRGDLITGVTAMSVKKILVAAGVLVAVGASVLTYNEVQSQPDPGPRTERQADLAPSTIPGSSAAAVGADDTGPAATESAEPRYVFAGRVVDEGRAPIAGARVDLLYLLPTTGLEGWAGFLQPLLQREYERHESPFAISGSDGGFRFARPYPSESCLRVTAAGFAPGIVRVRGPADDIEIVLHRGLVTRVLVTDAKSEPVVGARVRLTTGPVVAGNGLRYAQRARQLLAEAVTDANGEARLPRANEDTLSLEVEPRESRHGAVHMAFPRAADEVRVEVPAVRTYRIRIVDAQTGAAMPGAYLAAVRAYRFGSLGRELPFRRIPADADGWVEAPWQQGWRMHASAPGYEWKFATGNPIKLRRSWRVDGRVVDSDGRRMAGVPIFVSMESNPFEGAAIGLPLVAAWTDENGEFSHEVKQLIPSSLPKPPDAGLRTLFALWPDHPPAFVDGLRVEPGGRAGVELRFPRPATVALTVVDRDGAGVAGIPVELQRHDPAAPSWSMRKQRGGLRIAGLLGRTVPPTDADGRVVIAGLPPGNYLVRAKNAEQTFTLEEGATDTVRIVFGAGPVLEGHLLDRDGEPLAGLFVQAYGPAHVTTKTDEEGRFRIEDAKPGVYHFSTQFSSGRYQWRAEPGQPTEVREPARKARLRIEVAGAAEVEYSLWTESGGVAPPENNEFLPLKTPQYLTGEFMPGRGVLVIRAKGHGWRAVLFDAKEATTTTVKVELPAAGRCEGRVTGLPEGKWTARVEPVPDLHARLQKENPQLAYGINRTWSGWDWWTTVRDDGGFAIGDLTPGRWRVRVGRQPDDGPGFVDLVTAEIDIRSGETTSVRLKS